jgi:FKBP-type peptidyl-prolyl cis-trans isomerase
MAEITTPSGLVIDDLTVGNWLEASAGQYVFVHYTGWRRSRLESNLDPSVSQPV